MSDLPEQDERGGLPSASKMERVCSCPGSENLIKTLPPIAFEPKDEKPNELAERGTRIHKARETGNTLELDEEEDELYQNGLAYEARQVEKFKSTYGITELIEGPRELRLWVNDPRTMMPLASGQLDVHYHIPDYRYVLINDWKSLYLSNLGPAKGDWQLRFQALAFWLEFPQVELIRVSFTKCMFPNSDLDYCDYSPQDLKYSYDSLIFHLWESTQPDARRHPGHWCRWCPAKAWCREAMAFAAIPSYIADRTLIGEKPDNAIQKVTPEDLKYLWENGSTIKGILEAAVDRLKTFTDEELKALELARGKGRVLRWVEHTEKAMVYLRDNENWTEHELWSALQFLNGKLVELAMTHKDLNKKDAGAWVRDTLKDFSGEKTCEQPIVSANE
jgi:hypothetical protein